MERVVEPMNTAGYDAARAPRLVLDRPQALSARAEEKPNRCCLHDVGRSTEERYKRRITNFNLKSESFYGVVVPALFSEYFSAKFLQIYAHNAPFRM
jgi:hypothetical protein